jgi:hypothetical protein
MAKITYEEAMAEFFPEGVPWHLVKRKPQPKPAAAKAKERWAQKPIEAVIRDEAAHNETLIGRLRAERRAAEQAEFRRAQYQALIDSVWQSQLDHQAQLAELRPSFHRGPGDPDWR